MVSHALSAAPAETADHWNEHARQWQWVASPLRPAAEDLAIAAAAIQQWSDTTRTQQLSAALLGVTPELASMPWPSGTTLTAIDRSMPMIEGVWPTNLPGCTAICGNWESLPLRDGSHGVVIGDGCFVLLAWPECWQKVLSEARRVLQSNGLFVMRFFLRPDSPESLDDIFADLEQGRIGSFHAFKWRLAAALHGTLEEGVRIAEVWQTWHERIAEPQQLASRLGWPVEVVKTIDNYRGAPARYTFPTLDEVRRAMAGTFREADCCFPVYELGDRCPTLLLEPA